MNADLARYVLDELRRAGVEELCVCPGGRNAPFIELLPGDFRVTWHFEERSAAYFAVGRIKATNRPVAVITTSGTAAGELLPAAMEAHFSGSPLVLITADRPRGFRGSGAPQAAYQEGLFGVYARVVYDLDGAGESGARSQESEGNGAESRLTTHYSPLTIHPTSPTHINVCFEDPQSELRAVPGTVPVAKPVRLEHASDHVSRLTSHLSSCRNSFVIVGALAPDERPDVLKFLLTFPGMIYCESLSGLREAPGLRDRLVRVADGIFQRADPPFDGVLRLGGVPTHRLWRDLEDKYAHLSVVSVSSLPFSGLGRESGVFPLPPGEGLAATGGSLAWGEGEVRVPQAQSGSSDCVPDLHPLPHPPSSNEEGVQSLLAAYPDSEPGLVRRLSERIDPGSSVFLGNSLPIREWDLAATLEPRGFEMRASRGLNGIDGQVSTFLGTCTPDRANWALLGDLTTLYDLAGPWPIVQLDPEIAATIVILNNGGGRIFDRMFQRPEFQNEHTKHFEAWAALWGLSYLRTSDPATIPPLERGVRIVELIPDASATKAFWTEFDEAYK